MRGDARRLSTTRGPIMLECIRHLRDHPESINSELFRVLRSLTGEVDHLE